MSREAMKLALEALEFFKGLSLSMKEIERAEEAITALREALAEQPAPVQPTALSIYEAIKHGDAKHQEWLRSALENVFAGLDVPREPAQISGFDVVLDSSMPPNAMKLVQPAQQDIPDLIAGALGVSRGTAYDLMREALAQQQEPVANVWEMFAAYLIDKREGEIISEEGLQRSMADMLADPNYTSPQPAQQQEPVAGLLVGQDSDGRYVSIAAKAHADTLPLGKYKLYTSLLPAQRTPLTEGEIADTLPRYRLADAVDIVRAVEDKHNIKEQP